MKTIEERAKEYAPDAFDPDYILFAREEYIVNKERSAYIAGATEQKTIDIEKACKWLKKELRKLAMDELKDNFLENEFKFVLKSQIPEWLINFRKVMEEQE